MSLPKFYEKSALPKALSRLAPIEINAISFGFWVWCRGFVTDRIKTHESIHFRQQLELGFVFFWLLYPLFFLVLYFKTKSGAGAYRLIPFELEAYDNQDDEHYLANRRAFAWARYVFDRSAQP